MSQLLKKLFGYLQDPDSKNAPVAYEVKGKKCEPVSRGQFWQWLGNIQAYLEEHDIKAGARVVILAPNSAFWLAVDLALASRGVISVPLYARQDPQELSDIILDADPAALIVSEEALFQGLSTEAKKRPWVNFKQLQTKQSSAPTNDLPEASALCTLVYTSGTSGRSKGVQISYQNLDYMVGQTTQRLEQTFSASNEDERVFHFLPLCFMGSRIMAWTQLSRACPLYLSTDLQNLKEELQAVDPHYYLNVPAILERIKQGVEAQFEKRGGLMAWLYRKATQAVQANSPSLLGLAAQKFLFPKIKKRIGKQLDFLICGSAPLQAATQEWFFALGIPVLQVYGLTETTAIVTMDDRLAVRAGYVGRPIEGTETRISELGELWVKGPGIFSGYWRREQETAEVFEDKWFKTGDKAEVDADGRLKILGRLKNIIVSESGHNIVPEPIERMFLLMDPKIEHVVLIGHARPFLTAIVSGDITQERAEALTEEINQNLPHYRKIKRCLTTFDSFTPENGLLTANHKLKRRAIEAFYQKNIDGLYSQGGAK